MWRLTIHGLFLPSPVLLLVAISEIPCVQPTMFPTQKTCKAMAASAFVTCTNCETGSNLPEVSGVVVRARANQSSTKAPSSFRWLILNSHCSFHGRRLISAPEHLPGRCFTHTQSFLRSPSRQLWLPVHWHIWNMRSPGKPSTWTLMPWWIQRSIACSCSSDIYVLLRLLCLIHSRMPQCVATRCVAFCVMSSNALKSLIIASGCFPSRRFWGPMNSGYACDWELRGAARSEPERDDNAGCSTVLPTLSAGLGIELSHFKAENATLKGHFLRQVVEIVIEGIPTVHDVHFMCLFISLGRVLLQGSGSTNLFDPMRHQLNLQNLEVSIWLVGNIYLVANIIPPGIDFAPLLERCASLRICFLVYLSLPRELRSQGIGFGLRLFTGSVE